MKKYVMSIVICICALIIGLIGGYYSAIMKFKLSKNEELPKKDTKILARAIRLSSNEIARAILESGVKLPENLKEMPVRQRPSQSELPEYKEQLEKIDFSDSPAIGPDDAQIKIIEFSDFQCPYSRRVQDTLAVLEEKYPTKIKRFFKNYPMSFHPNAMIAHQACIAAHLQEKFWEMKVIILRNPDKFDRDSMIGFAKEIGLDMEKFEADLDSKDVKDEISRDQNDGKTLGVNGTPTFFINGKKLVGAQPIEEFQRIVEEELKK